MTAPAFHTDEQRVRGARPRLPSSGAVLRAHLRTTGLALRAPALVAAALLALLTLWAAFQITGKDHGITLNAWPTQLPGLIGALLAIAVWGNDERFGPAFLWTLPVDRSRHALTRVAAGWLWLMAGVGVLVLWLLALTGFTGGRMLPPETLHVVTSPLHGLDAVDPASLQRVRWNPGPLIWLVPFTAATVTYLLASGFALGTRHPVRWLVGVVVAFVLSTVAGGVASTQLDAPWLDHAPARLLDLLFSTRYGLDAVLTARIESLGAPATLATGQQTMVWWAVPKLGDWGTATLLWTGAGLLALWAAAARHRERRRA